MAARSRPIHIASAVVGPIPSQVRLVRCRATSARRRGRKGACGFQLSLVQRPACAPLSLRQSQQRALQARCRRARNWTQAGLVCARSLQGAGASVGRKTDHIVRAARFAFSVSRVALIACSWRFMRTRASRLEAHVVVAALQGRDPTPDRAAPLAQLEAGTSIRLVDLAIACSRSEKPR
jgi:hypothetical protein